MKEKTYYLYHKISPIGLNYLGITTQNPYKYKGSGKYWKNHLKAHKIDIDDIITNVLFTTNNKEELKKEGTYYSELYDIVKSDKWANLVIENGEGGSYDRIFKHSEETKYKLRELNKGRTHSERTKNKIRNKLLGHEVSNEAREKISKKTIGRKLSDELKKKMSEARKGEKNHFFGKKHSKESLEKMKNKIYSEETKEKIRKSRIGKKASDNTKIKMSKSHIENRRSSLMYNPTPILQYDLFGNLIKKWRDRIELRDNGFNVKNIVQACKSNNKTVVGYKWKFYSE